MCVEQGCVEQAKSGGVNYISRSRRLSHVLNEYGYESTSKAGKQLYVNEVMYSTTCGIAL